MKSTSHRRKRQAGMTLIELLIAVTLFGAISASMGVVLNIAFTSMKKIDDKVDFNRRIIASQRTLDQILHGMIPVIAQCAGKPIGISALETGTRFLSSHSLTEGSRGRVQIVELFVASSPNGGFRLLLNERPYLGKASLSFACAQPFQVTEASFILADRLSRCRFAFRRFDEASGTEIWFPGWVFPEWPSAIRIEMAPLKFQANQIQPATIYSQILVKDNSVDDASR